MKCLLIGGPNNGERHALPEGLGVYRVLNASRASTAEPLSESTTYNTAFYRPFQLTAGDERFTVYVCDGVTPAEVMRRLIESYHGYAYSGQSNLKIPVVVDNNAPPDGLVITREQLQETATKIDYFKS